MRAPSVVAPPGRRSRKRGKMRPPSSARGARLLPYVDDFLFLAHSLAAALLLRARVESLLTRLGLKRNPRKGEWDPTQALTHLIPHSACEWTTWVFEAGCERQCL